MVTLINILGFLSLCCILALVLEEELVKVIPISTGLWILSLYLLALIRGLAAFDFLCAGLILICVYLFYRRYDKAAVKELLHLLMSPSAIALYVVLIVAFLLLRDILLMNRDDLGCWALEVKSITYYNGFAPKGEHASILYGSYFPGVTLFRWWTAHLFPAYFDGMMAVGSAWLFTLLLSPFFSLLRCPAPLAPFFGLGIAGILLLLPSVIDLMCYMNLCAELPMSAAFAGILYSEFYAEEKNRKPLFMAYAFSLFFFKLPGLGYGASLLVLFVLLSPKAERKEKTIGIAKLALPCLLPSLSWMLFCAVMGRSDYFTVSMPESAGVSVGFAQFWADYGSPYLSSICKAFFTWPLHALPDAIIGLSAFVIVLIYTALCLSAAKLIPGKSTAFKALAVYVLVMAFVLFWGLYLVHCFIFREAPYFNPENMCYTISRYGLPLLLGTLLFLLYVYLELVLNSKRRVITKLIFTGFCAGCIVACSCVWTVYYRTVDYSHPNAAAEEQGLRVSQLCSGFLSGLDSEPKRFVFVCEEDESFNYKDQVRLQYMAVPSSIYTLQLSPGLISEGSFPVDITALMEFYDADYAYFFRLSEDTLQAISQSGGLENDVFYSPAELEALLS